MDFCFIFLYSLHTTQIIVDPKYINGFPPRKNGTTEWKKLYVERFMAMAGKEICE